MAGATRRVAEDGRERAAVVPADPGGSSLAVMRSLSRRGVHIVGVGTHRGVPALASRHCHESQVVPDPNDDVDGYADALLALAEREDVGTIFPLWDADAYVLSNRRDAFAAQVGAPWPDRTVMRRALDRYRLVQRANDVNVPTPETALLSEFDGWDERYVIKPRYNVYVDGGRTWRHDPRSFEAGVQPDVESEMATMRHEPIAQRYVPQGGEFGYFALYDDGSPVAQFQHRRIRSYTYDGGASVYRKSFHDPALASAGRRVLDALDWHGPAMVEFRRNPLDGTYRLLEVNPRFWGSLTLALVAGVDFPAHYWALARERPHSTVVEPSRQRGEDVEDHESDRSLTYEVGIGCHRLIGEARYLQSVRSETYKHVERPSLLWELAAVLVSLVTQPRFDILSTRDPEPFVQSLIVALRMLLDSDGE